jgi:hypothetical protein
VNLEEKNLLTIFPKMAQNDEKSCFSVIFFEMCFGPDTEVANTEKI